QAAASRRPPVPVHVEPHPGRVRAGHRRCRVRGAAAAQGHAPLCRFHQALRDGGLAARRRPAAGGRQRPVLRPAAQSRQPLAPDLGQLPGLRGEAVTSGVGKGGRFPQVALFDLDGTLLDSAPDMVATANRMLAARGLGQVDADALRKHVSKGARAMVSFVFAEAEGEAHAALVAEFLEVYQQELGRHSRLFDGIAAMLEALEAAGSRWGIITNKAEYLARDVVAGLGWQERCAVLVGGDTYA